jgi:hypothetical protein
MAIGEVRLRDWWRVTRRELAAGLSLGAVLGALGFLRIVLWQAVKPSYGEHYVLIGATVCGSLIGVVTLGTLAGSLLPFVLRRLGLDPASASAPFVATVVDVAGRPTTPNLRGVRVTGWDRVPPYTSSLVSSATGNRARSSATGVSPPATRSSVSSLRHVPGGTATAVRSHLRVSA